MLVSSGHPYIILSPGNIFPVSVSIPVPQDPDLFAREEGPVVVAGLGTADGSVFNQGWGLSSHITVFSLHRQTVFVLQTFLEYFQCSSPPARFGGYIHE